MSLFKFQGLVWSCVAGTLSTVILSVILVGGLITQRVGAQTMSSEFTGVVSDPTGAVIPNATVTVTNQNTRAQRSATTDSTGTYLIDAVSVGTYTLEVEARGFKKYVQTNLAVSPVQVKRLDVALQVGAVTQSVEVTDTVPAIQTQNPTLTTGLPAVVRDRPIITMSRGALLGEQLSWAPGSAAGGLYTFNGNRADFNQYNIEGLQYMYISSSYINAALEEVSVVLSNASAEYARPVTLNGTFKSGSNQFHAEYWRIFVNPRLDALRDPFSPATLKRGAGVTSWRQFLTVSGPIIKNKTFFFFNWGRPNSFSSQIVGQLQSYPSLAMQGGNFSKYPATIIDPTTGNPFPGNIIPDNRISLVSKAIMSQFMGSTVNYQGSPDSFINNVQDLSGRYRQDNDWHFKIDHNLGTRDVFSGFYSRAKVISNFDRWHGMIGSRDALHTSGQDNVYNWAAGLTHTHTFRSNVVNQFKGGVTRFVYYHNQIDSWKSSAKNVLGKDIVSKWGLQGVSTPSLSGQPLISIGGWLQTYSDNQSLVADTRYSAYDNVSVIKGRHTLKFGYAGIKLLEDGPAVGAYFGSFSFGKIFTGAQVANPGVCAAGVVCGDGFADFLLGLPISSTRFQPRSIIARRKWEHGAFIQDDFRVNAKLTLNYGLRWVRYTVPYDKNGLYFNFDPLKQQVVVPDQHALDNVNPAWPKATIPVVLASAAGFPSKLLDGSSSWQPRIGFAYRITPRTVLRGGYGLYNGASRFAPLQTGGPFVISEGFTNEPRPGTATGALLAWPNAFPTAVNVVTRSSGTGFSKDYREAKTHNYNLTLEREMRPNWGLQVTYRGVNNTDLLVGRNLNALAPSTTSFSQSRLPFPNFSGLSFIDNRGASWYQSLVVQLTHPWVKGLYSTITLTNNWSGGLDPGVAYSADQAIYFPEDPFNINRDNVVRTSTWPSHDLLWDFVADLPVGRGKRFATNTNKVLNAVIGNWSFSGVFSWRSGLAFTPGFSGVDFSNTGRFGGRPDLVPGCDPYAGARDVHNLWFNPKCFTQPALGTDGNVQINSLTGPRAWTVNFAPWKQFPLSFIREGTKLQFGANIVNLFNHPVYGIPNATVNGVNPGRIFSVALNGARGGGCCHDERGSRKFIIDMRIIF